MCWSMNRPWHHSCVRMLDTGLLMRYFSWRLGGISLQCFIELSKHILSNGALLQKWTILLVNYTKDNKIIINWKRKIKKYLRMWLKMQLFSILKVSNNVETQRKSAHFATKSNAIKRNTKEPYFIVHFTINLS